MNLVWALAVLVFFALYGASNVLSRIHGTGYWSVGSDLSYVLRTIGLHVAVGSVALAGVVVLAVRDTKPPVTAAVIITVTAIPTGVLVGTKIEEVVRKTVRSRMASEGEITDSFSTEDGGTSDDGTNGDDTPPRLLRVVYRIGDPIVTSPYLRTAGQLAVGAAIVFPLGVGAAYELPVVIVGWLLAAPVLGLLVTVSQSSRSPDDRPEPPVGARNVIVCMVDDVRRDRMSVYGYDRDTTPFLERTADEAMRFDNCVSAGLRSGHSIPSLLTGAFASVHQYGANTDLRMISDELEDNGYRTAAISGNPHLNLSRFGDRFDWYLYLHHGKEYLFRAQRVLAQWLDRLGLRRLPLHYFRADIEFINELAKSFIQSQDDERPFFLYLSYIDVHHPYVRSDAAVTSFAAAHGENIGSPSRIGSLPVTDELKRWGYDETIRYTDEHLEDLYAFLSEENLLEETVVLITSDHGEMLGERNIWDHIDIPYNHLFEVPLIAYTPSSSGEVVDQVVSGAQFPSLLLALAGVEPSEDFRSQWLMELAVDGLTVESNSEYALVDFYDPAVDTKGYAPDLTIDDQRALIGKDWKYYQNCGEATFYRYDDVFMDDPVPDHEVPTEIKTRMQAELEGLNAELDRQSAKDDDTDPYADIDDQRLRQQLEELGYL